NELYKDINNNNTSLLHEENNTHQWHHVRDIIIRIVSGVIIIATMIWVNNQVTEGAMSATIIAAFVLMMFSITDALMPMSSAVEEVPIYTDSIIRMNKLSHPYEKKRESSETSEPSNHPTIHLTNVTYHYTEQEETIINDLNLTIKPGEKIALLGKSGAGKSTLLKLTSGVVRPNEGQIKLDLAIMNDSYLSTM